MVNKKKKSINPKPQKKHSNVSGKSSKSVITNIYTYSKKKPKRIGKTCIHFDFNKLTCKLSKSLCRNADTCSSYRTNFKEVQSSIKSKILKHDENIVGITTIVLSDNRKCIDNKHSIIDLNAKIRIAQPNGEVSICDIPAAYCKECDIYFVLKKDYKIAKSNGKILCPIIDLTQEGEKKNRGKNLSTSESRIHQLGYNV